MSDSIRMAVLAAIFIAAPAISGCAATTVASRSEIAASQPFTAPGDPTPATSASENADEESQETAWNTIARTLGRDGVRNNAVLTFTILRDDLFVTIEGMDVPTEAGVESRFDFWHCTCGKTSVIGQFCVLDYESNDVIDALRAGNIEISSIAPLVLRSRVSPLILRFQGEGKAAELAATLRMALRYIGKERTESDKR